jgi:hypothetical protein
MSSATGVNVETVLEACWQALAEHKPERPAWLDLPERDQPTDQ